VVHRGIRGGIERVARLLMPVLFGILLLLLISAMTLKGAGEALSFIFKPDFSQLRPIGVLEALGHSFFTLSLGMGAMITYGSYLGRRESVVRSSLVVVLLDTVIAIAATVIMFSVIFSFDMTDAVDKSTAGMLFITLPTLFYENVPFGIVLAPMFYMLVGFAALTSTISLLEVVVSYFIDQRKWTRPRATWTCSAGIFLLSTLCGLSFGGWAAISDFNWIQAKRGLFDHLDHVAANWLLPVGGFFITLAAGWAMTREETESELVSDDKPRWFSYPAWRFCIRFLAPAAVAAIIVAVIAGKDFS
jgi:NSS family neurotransmitter:Na+ symporter